MKGRSDGELVEAVIKPAEDANGWVLAFTTVAGEHLQYTAPTGTEKVFHSLDHATGVAQELGFVSIRVEESF
jgi:hypothetical protein